MRVIGIVAEYNPFHNGHKYQIDEVKKMYPDSVIVVALSSHYTIRGEVSVLSKWDKTIIALKYGVDVVLEIPFVFSNQSADIFSYAAVKILNEFHVDTLVFGSESDDLDLLFNSASVQIDNPKFDDLVKSYINKGLSYPNSVLSSIRDLTGKCVMESNDILAVSYIKEILRNNYEIEIVPIKRTNKFLDTTSDDVIVSASNVRERFKKGEDISKYVPLEVVSCMRNVRYDLLFNFIRYKVVSERDNISTYHLINEGLENRIIDAATSTVSFNDFIDKIKTKRYTYNKINRILINVFTGFTKNMANRFRNLEYIRILGLSKAGKEYYSKIKKNVSLPVITKFEKYDMLNYELKVTTLYSMIVDDNSLIYDEIRKHVIIFDN